MGDVDALLRCSRCNQDLPLDEFYRTKDGKHSGWCKKCLGDRAVARHQIATEYGVPVSRISQAAASRRQLFERLRAKQHGQCPGCLREGDLCFYYNDTLGLLRALLCRKCSAALHLMDDDPVISSRLTQFLVGALNKPKLEIQLHLSRDEEPPE